MKAYLANGLFSAADQMFNQYIASEMRKAFPEIDLYVPQELVNPFITISLVLKS